MANEIETFWNAADALLTTNALAIGIVSVESGEVGKSAAVKVPGAVTWVDFDQAQFLTHSGAITAMSVKLMVFCVAAGKGTSKEAIAAATSIAINVAITLGGKTASKSVLSLADPPLDVVDASANRAVVSVTFDCMVPL